MAAWEDYCASAEPQNEPLPEPLHEALDSFEKLLVLKIFRPEKLAFAFTDYVHSELGKMYIENQAVTMDTIYHESDCKTPVIFILSSGADPISGLYKFAKEMQYDSKL
jgi:dynein heavy chain